MLQNLEQEFEDGANIQQQWGDLLVGDAKSPVGQYLPLQVIAFHSVLAAKFPLVSQEHLRAHHKIAHSQSKMLVVLPNPSMLFWIVPHVWCLPESSHYWACQRF
jgi:hypothetical protein